MGLHHMERVGMGFAPSSGMNSTKEINMLKQILESANTAMLTTCGSKNQLQGRPMHIAGVGKEGEVTFLTSPDADWLETVREHDSVGVSVLDAGHYAFINGVAVIEESQERVRKLWSSGMSVWFPDGPDKGVIMVTVMPLRAEYWDVRGGSMVRFAYEYAKAKLTGEKINLPDTPKMHGTVAQ